MCKNNVTGETGVVVRVGNASATIIDNIGTGVDEEVITTFGGIGTDILKCAITEDLLTVEQMFKIVGGFGYTIRLVPDPDSRNLAMEFNPMDIYKEEIEAAQKKLEESDRAKKRAELDELLARVDILRQELGILPKPVIKYNETEVENPEDTVIRRNRPCVYRDPVTGTWRKIPMAERTEIIIEYAKAGHNKEKLEEIFRLSESVILASLSGRVGEINEHRAAHNLPLMDVHVVNDEKYAVRMGRRFYEDIKHTGASQKDLSRRYGIANSTISKYIKAYRESIAPVETA